MMDFNALKLAWVLYGFVSDRWGSNEEISYRKWPLCRFCTDIGRLFHFDFNQKKCLVKLGQLF